MQDEDFSRNENILDQPSTGQCQLSGLEVESASDTTGLKFTNVDAFPEFLLPYVALRV